MDFANTHGLHLATLKKKFLKMLILWEKRGQRLPSRRTRAGENHRGAELGVDGGGQEGVRTFLAMQSPL